MRTLKQVLQFLAGKKSAIASILGAVVAYLAAKGLLGELEVVLIGSIMTVIFGGTSYFTGKLIYKK